MVTQSISASTNLKVSFNSSLRVLTQDGGNSGTIPLLDNPFSITAQVVLGGLQIPGDLLLLVVCIMPKQRGKPKRGPTHYDFLFKCTSPTTLIAPSQALAQQDIVSPSIALSPSMAQNWDFFDTGPIYVEEQFPPTQSQPISTPMMVSPQQTQHAMAVPPRTLLQEYYSGCPVLEEIALVTNTVNIGNVEDEDVRLNFPLQHSFSTEHLKFIIEMRSDMVDQLHRHKILICSLLPSQKSLKGEYALLVANLSLFLWLHSFMENAANSGASGV